MHAYLIVGSDKEVIDRKIKQIVNKEKSKIIQFPISKIKDTRELGKYLKLSINTKTAILIKDIDKSTTESLNAFLKNLEEPQENVIFILTAKHEFGVIPTILSRCQLIRTVSQDTKAEGNFAQSFLTKSTPEKLLELSKIKARDEAIVFMQNLISSLHITLIKGRKPKHVARVILKAEDTLKALNANGNVTLQLANFAINN